MEFWEITKDRSQKTLVVWQQHVPTLHIGNLASSALETLIDGFDPLVSAGFTEGFVDALTAHARFVGATRIAWPRFARHRALGREVRARLGPEGRLRA